jgi:hypothetical protein
MFKKTPELAKFEKFAAAHLGIKKLPVIYYVGHQEDAKKAFGDFTQSDDKIRVRTVDRHPIDVMRTLAHELAHYKWKLEGKRGDNKPGGASENYAHEMAGKIMRNYDNTHGFMFKASPLKEDGAAAGLAPAAGNATGSAVVGTGDDTKNMTWAPKKKKLNDIVTRKPLGVIRGPNN